VPVKEYWRAGCGAPTHKDGGAIVCRDQSCPCVPIALAGWPSHKVLHTIVYCDRWGTAAGSETPSLRLGQAAVPEQGISAPLNDTQVHRFLTGGAASSVVVVIVNYLDYHNGRIGRLRREPADRRLMRASGANVMDEVAFTAAKQRLDLEIDKLGSSPKVGILMGIDLYTEFRRRGLLKDAIADFRLWKFTLQGYRDLFVTESATVASDNFRLGT
jgi:hypothetical protein